MSKSEIQKIKQAIAKILNEPEINILPDSKSDDFAGSTRKAAGQRVERFQLTTDVKYPLARVASASFHALEVPTDECASGEGTRAGSH